MAFLLINGNKKQLCFNLINYSFEQWYNLNISSWQKVVQENIKNLQTSKIFNMLLLLRQKIRALPKTFNLNF